VWMLLFCVTLLEAPTVHITCCSICVDASLLCGAP
jgi:hypothetical protein